MDDVLNVTYITLDGHVELNKYRYFYFIIMFTAGVLAICCNLTIVCLIWINKSLHEPMYIFITALLLNSVLYSTTVYPKLLIDFLSERQIISYSMCLFQFFTTYTLGSSEFLLLSAMAYDRFVSICKPLQYHIIMGKSTVSVFLVLAWLLPACHVVVLATISANQTLCNFNLKGILCNNLIYRLHCVSSRALNIFGAVMLINVVVLPVVFIGFTYIKILTVASRSSRDVRRKAAETCLPHLLVLINFSFLVTFDSIVVRLEANIPKTAYFIMTLQAVLCHPLFNPLIYGLKMKEISKNLKILFCENKLIKCIDSLG